MMHVLPDLMVAVGAFLLAAGLLVLFGARREVVIDLRDPPLELEPADRYEPLAIEAAKASSSSSRDA